MPQTNLNLQAAQEEFDTARGQLLALRAEYTSLPDKIQAATWRFSLALANLTKTKQRATEGL